MSTVKACYALDISFHEGEGLNCAECVEQVVQALIKTEHWRLVKFIDTSMYQYDADWQTNVVMYYNELVYAPVKDTIANIVKDLPLVYDVYLKEMDVYGTAN